MTPASPRPFDGPTLLDGAMGTALLAGGLPAGALPEAWVLERPEAIAAVHAAHAAAGAQVVLTCTFNAAGPRLDPLVPPDRVGALCAAAVRLARRAAPGARVAGDLGPTALYGPGRPPPDGAAVRARYARAAGALAAAGADLLWAESQWDLAEARLALDAARAAGLPVVVTFALRAEAGRLAAPDGTPAEALLEAVADAGAAAAGVNCVPPGPALAALAAWAARRLAVRFVAKPSPGLPGEVLGPDAFAEALRPAVQAGLGVAGGCCGAGPGHLAALRRLLAAARAG
ncbi:homocysteine S-methyltransferase [Anaeromyxobacter sp. K]|uniref:homocysteine S-methyltransferase family protein n=1 Tax=Anaeromyxobacter sp. (strain K) TaxID=447217 RepID=UPI00015F83B9|nr:homocysteine S-methyltransferase family protein [Anaeromyxobacter sp. K]ACG73290.1 homocysteine S-methyltransferase [Anaeromyxobacter sp. K]